MEKLLIVAGGTGGHIFPAMAVANAIEKQGVKVNWLGSHVGMERDLVSKHFPMTFISIEGVRGKNVLTRLLSPFKIFIAVFQAYQIIKKLNPDLVLAMGGFVAGPGGIAAWLARKPLVIHEQNAIAGYTNRILVKFSNSVLQAFPNAFPAKTKVTTAGNPVRSDFFTIEAPNSRLANRLGPLRVLVLGGSRGARAINHAVREVAEHFAGKNQLEIRHQVGQADLVEMQQAYSKLAVKAEVFPFIEDVVSAYAWADVAICRAGAMTIAELAAAGVASILIPFPHAVDDHQRFNAAYLSQQDAAHLIIQKDLTSARLIDLLQQYLDDRNLLLQMGLRAKALSKPDAVRDVIQECENVCNALLKKQSLT